MEKRDNFKLVCKVQCCTEYKPEVVYLFLRKYNACLYIYIWCVFSYRGILWTFASGSFHPVWEGRRTVRITRKGYQRSALFKCRMINNMTENWIIEHRMIAANVMSNIRHQVAPDIKERMMKRGTMMVGYQPMDGHVNFFRMVVVSPLLTTKNMDFFLDEIEELGKDL